MAPSNRSAFTLVEMMLVIAIIAILSAIAIPRYNNMLMRSKEGVTRGNLGSLRSALSIYYGDNEQVYPSDDLSSLFAGAKYIPAIQVAKTPPYHLDNAQVTPETVPSDTGGWSYDNDSTDSSWGTLWVDCLHSDLQGNVWTSY